LENEELKANSVSVRRMLLALGFSLCVAGNSALAAGLDLEKADALIKQGKAAEAYSMLEPFEFEQSGNVKFDYLLGIAALDSGKPDKATIAFERVLAVDPNFAGARIDMGRAYYQLGDITRAKSEFETVLAQNPPPAARATINNYLAEIAKQESAKKTQATGYIEGSVGHDSNVNYATSQTQVAVPALGNLTFILNPTGVATPDKYLGIGFGGEVNHEINPRLAVFAGADVHNRTNNTAHAFDSTSLDARAGVAMGDVTNVVRLGVLNGRYILDGRTNRDTNGVNAEWRHLINPANQLSAFAQVARYRFEPTVSVNDFDQSVYGAYWLHVANDGKGLVSASLFGGNEKAPARADGGKRFNGVRLGGQVQLDQKTELFGGVGAQFSNYEQTNVSFAVTRDDKQYDASLGINWHLDNYWTVRPQISYIRNNTNIVIYQFDHTDIFVTIRRDFK
jgi:tetratricopeptide (TPR) repeat protein